MLWNKEVLNLNVISYSLNYILIYRMHIHVSFQVLSKFKCINTNQESRIHSKTVFISPYTQSRGTTTKERGIPTFIYKKEKNGNI